MTLRAWSADRAGIAAFALSLAACAPAVAPRTAPGVPSPPSRLAAPWEVPAAALATQRLYRVRYDGPQGEGNVKVTLRLATVERYQVQAADPLGRPLWALDVAGGRGLWVDHRAESTCRLEGRLELAGVPLSPFPLLALPPLLLGRLPAAPGVGEERAALRAAASGDARIDFADAEGRRWTARLTDGRPRSWTLWAAGGREPRISWLAAGDEAVLSDREQGVQLRWREIVAEPLAGDLEPVASPPGYREMVCGEADGGVAPDHPI